MDELSEIKAELRCYELNGSDAVQQIRGIYADLDDATNRILELKTENKKLREALDKAKTS